MRNPVFDIENWREIGATLAQNKTRTFMTAFGIFWGTAILALLIGGSKGLKSFMARNFEGFATNVAIVSPWRTTKPYKGFNKGMEVTFNTRDIAMVRRAIPEIDALSVVNAMGASATYGQKSSSATLTGVESEYSKIFTPIIYEGRYLNASDDANDRKICVLGKRVANELFGTGSAIGKEISVNGIYYKVVGVAGQTSEISIMSKIDDSILIPNSLLRRSYNMGDDVGMFLFTIKQGYSPSEYEGRIRRM